MNYQKNKKYITNSRDIFFKVVLNYIDDQSKILDIGSGDASFAKVIGSKDIYMLDGNIQTVENLKNDYKNIIYGQLPVLPYEDNMFDCIHTSHLIEHLSSEDLYTLLKECDRCLKPQGYLIISAPLFWSEFYDDMSHVKPYNPKLFQKYLSWGSSLCCTKELISTSYKMKELVYRYNELSYNNDEAFVYSEFINTIYRYTKKIKHLLGFRKFEKSGFTIVFQKCELE